MLCIMLNTSLTDNFVLFFSVFDGFLCNHVLYLHQTCGIGSFVFLQLHGDIFDGFLIVGDHYVFQRVYTAAGTFNLLGQELCRFFRFRQSEQWLHRIRERNHSTVQFTGCECHTIRINVAKKAIEDRRKQDEVVCQRCVQQNA